MKVRSLYELEEKLDEDLSWRRKEFTTLKFMISGARAHQKLVLLRSAITLLYAHWEGHIKHCALVYLKLLNCLGVRYCDMTDNFLQLSLSEQFKQGFSIKKFSSQRDIFLYLTTEQRSSFSINEDIIIDTESNLKYEVIFNILEQLGLDSSVFELKENFINSKLLRCRNAIAHGDKVELNDLEDTYQELEDELMEMIETFQTLIRNAASNRTYLKSV
ncbi:MAE_28990/MAE_18760 family HEPN-like nuclease [Atlantibacter hermannii]|uniref:MAE_28990/MAE_18760 family HEPN-like nuclease n=1 Tax=Atlantibacter hermannii TaxID=565 RepID=UPI00289DF9A9|nr:MAE_28990/MAE_18760 family HEPN-like nuclease [Atlantibacter hermannii]